MNLVRDAEFNFVSFIYCFRGLELRIQQKIQALIYKSVNYFESNVKRYLRIGQQFGIKDFHFWEFHLKICKSQSLSDNII